MTTYRECTVVAPNSDFGANIGQVHLELHVDPTLLKLSHAAIPSNLPDYYSHYPGGAGITFPSRVTTPDPDNYGGTGGWNIVQKVNPNRSRVNGGVTQTCSYNGQPSLDVVWSYAGVDDYPYTILYGTQDVGVFPANTLFDYLADMPAVELRVSNGGYIQEPIQWLDEAKGHDSFETWLMYIPPGTDSQFVPIKKLIWFWNGRAIRDSSSGTWSLSLPDPPSDSVGWNYEGGDFPFHPAWNQLITRVEIDTWTPAVP